jgi:hypothetical protein
MEQRNESRERMARSMLMKILQEITGNIIFEDAI